MLDDEDAVFAQALGRALSSRGEDGDGARVRQVVRSLLTETVEVVLWDLLVDAVLDLHAPVLPATAALDSVEAAAWRDHLFAISKDHPAKGAVVGAVVVVDDDDPDSVPQGTAPPSEDEDGFSDEGADDDDDEEEEEEEEEEEAGDGGIIKKPSPRKKGGDHLKSRPQILLARPKLRPPRRARLVAVEALAQPAVFQEEEGRVYRDFERRFRVEAQRRCAATPNLDFKKKPPLEEALLLLDHQRPAEDEEPSLMVEDFSEDEAETGEVSESRLTLARRVLEAESAARRGVPSSCASSSDDDGEVLKKEEASPPASSLRDPPELDVARCPGENSHGLVVVSRVDDAAAALEAVLRTHKLSRTHVAAEGRFAAQIVTAQLHASALPTEATVRTLGNWLDKTSAVAATAAANHHHHNGAFLFLFAAHRALVATAVLILRAARGHAVCRAGAIACDAKRPAAGHHQNAPHKNKARADGGRMILTEGAILAFAKQHSPFLSSDALAMVGVARQLPRVVRAALDLAAATPAFADASKFVDAVATTDDYSATRSARAARALERLLQPAKNKASHPCCLYLAKHDRIAQTMANDPETARRIRASLGLDDIPHLGILLLALAPTPSDPSTTSAERHQSHQHHRRSSR